MYLRRVRGDYQILKSVYSPEKGMPVQEYYGHFPIDVEVVPEDIMAMFDPDDRVSLVEAFDRANRKRLAKEAKDTLEELPKNLEVMSLYLSRHEPGPAWREMMLVKLREAISVVEKGL